MIGPHFQAPFHNWPQSCAALPAGTWFKSCDDLHILRDVKAVNPAFKTVFRKVYTQHQQPATTLEANRQKARTFFSTFIDGTFWQQELWRYIDAIEEWNEYLANSQTPEEKAIWLSWCTAVNQVWREYQQAHPNELGSGRPGGPIRLVTCNTAIGNEIDTSFAAVTAQYGNILGYHNYVLVNNGVIHPDNDRWLSNRWQYMDDIYRAANITVQWLFTEGGAYRTTVDGWKHHTVYGGNLDAYINGAIKYTIDSVAGWNRGHNNRALSTVLFTSGNVQGWDYYQLNEAEWPSISAFVSSYVPPTTPPPNPGDDWQDEVWQRSIELQVISLNPNAALQAAMFADGFTPVQSEFWMTPSDGVQRACQAAENVNTGQRRVYYAVVPQWNVVRWFSNTGDTEKWDVWPTPSRVITQAFGADPGYYGQFGLPGHEGLDIQAPNGTEIVSVWPGVVTEVVDEVDGHPYGKRVRVRTGKYEVTYGHLLATRVPVGANVQDGDLLGQADNTGRSRGPHLHLTMKHDDAYLGGPRYIGYPHNIIDPTPFTP